MATSTKYPECQKLRQVENVHKTLLAFLEWAEEQGWNNPDGDGYTTWRGSREDVIFEYMGVNKVRLEQERRRMLESIQNDNAR